VANERPFTGARATKSAEPGAEPARVDPKADKRERILRAAVKVFARKGFYATRVSEIAKAAGVADGTIYLYFESKDDVLVSLFQDRIVKLIAALEEAIAAAGDFDARFRRVVGLLDGRRELAEVVTVNLRQSSKLLKQYATPLFSQYLEVVAKLVADGQTEGAVRADVSPRLVARSLYGALDGVAMTWALGGGEAGQLKKAAAQVSELFLRGLKPGGAA
jgi:TetR/AcrR family fatty acid metabolism transcriptional regulator